MIKKVLIANSVGKDYEGNNFILFPSRWTACVGKTKSFNFYPYELAYLSTLLKKNKNLKVKMVDGNYEELTAKEYFEKYKSFKPDYLVMETSSIVYKYDLEFALKFKKKFGTKLIFCGQHATAFPKQVLKDGVDKVILGEFEEKVRAFIEGKKPETENLIDIKKLPWPEDEDIKRINYSNIGGCDYKEIEFFATRGCMMNCVFCVARQTYYGRSNFRPRKVKDIVDEIEYLKNKYPEMEGIFFDEENHNTDKKFVLELCREIIKRKLNNLKYDAMCGYWTMDEEMLRAMKKAGYYKLRIGIETASVKTSAGMKKNVNVDRITTVLKMAKKLGIRMYGTFTFGAPESNLTEDRKTLKLIEKLTDMDLLWDFQTSICTPQPGTPFFTWLEKNNYLLTKDWTKYNGGTAVYEYPQYKKEEIESNLPAAAAIYIKVMIKRHGMWAIIRKTVAEGGIKALWIKGTAFLGSYYKYLPIIFGPGTIVKEIPVD